MGTDRRRVQSNFYSQRQWWVDLPVAPPVPGQLSRCAQQLGRLLSTPNTDPRGSPLFPHVVSRQLLLQRQRELFIVTSVAAKLADFSCVKHTIHYEAFQTCPIRYVIIVHFSTAQSVAVMVFGTVTNGGIVIESCGNDIRLRQLR